MLHGVVEINGTDVGNWEAENIGLTEGSNPKYKKYTYRCRVDYRDNRGYPRFTGPFLVSHYDGDGALVLASKVLERANELFLTQDAQWKKAVENTDAKRRR
jgi:hypothetical protein